MKNSIKIALCAATVFFAACEKKVTIVKSVLMTQQQELGFIKDNFNTSDGIAATELPTEIKELVAATPGATVELAVKKSDKIVSKNNDLNSILVVRGIPISKLPSAHLPSSNAALVTKSNGLGDMELTTETSSNITKRWTPIIPKPSTNRVMYIAD